MGAIAVDFDGLNLSGDWIGDIHHMAIGRWKTVAIFRKRQAGQAGAAHAELRQRWLKGRIRFWLVHTDAGIRSANKKWRDWIAKVVRFLDEHFALACNDKAPDVVWSPADDLEAAAV